MTEINMWVFSFLLFLFLDIGWGVGKAGEWKTVVFFFFFLGGGIENPKVAFKSVKEQSGEWGRWACYCYIIQCRFTSILFKSTQLWFMEKKKEKEWELNSTNRGKRWGGHNCWDCCVGGTRTLVGSKRVRRLSLSVTCGVFFCFFFREALAKKAITS